MTSLAGTEEKKKIFFPDGQVSPPGDLLLTGDILLTNDQLAWFSEQEGVLLS